MWPLYLLLLIWHLYELHRRSTRTPTSTPIPSTFPSAPTSTATPTPVVKHSDRPAVVAATALSEESPAARKKPSVTELRGGGQTLTREDVVCAGPAALHVIESIAALTTDLQRKDYWKRLETMPISWSGQVDNVVETQDDGLFLLIKTSLGLSAGTAPVRCEAALPKGFNEVSEEDEEVVEKCLEIIRREKRASTALLQRYVRLGYTRAARIIDILEQRGILGPGEDPKPREILVDLDTFDAAADLGDSEPTVYLDVFLKESERERALLLNRGDTVTVTGIIRPHRYKDTTLPWFQRLELNDAVISSVEASATTNHVSKP